MADTGKQSVKCRPSQSTSKPTHMFKFLDPKIQSSKYSIQNSETLRQRARTLMSFVEKIGGDSPEDIETTLAAFFSQNKDLVVNALSKSGKISVVKELSPGETLNFLNCAKLTMSTFREVKAFLKEKLGSGSSVLCSEERLRKEIKSKQNDAPFETGTAELRKHAKDKDLSNIAYMRVLDPLIHIKNTINDAGEDQKNLDMLPNNEIWLLIGVDKGGNSNKIGLHSPSPELWHSGDCYV